MAAIREPIDQALAKLIFDHTLIKGVFETTGRLLMHLDDIPLEQLPALFIFQKGEEWVKIGKGIPAKRKLKRSLVLYASTTAPSEVLPSSLCNILMDAVDQVIELPGNPGNVQTLGGLVEHVYLEGEVMIAEGLLQNVSVLEVPITILLP